MLYGCEIWPERLANERMVEVFDNDSIRRILPVRRRDCVPSMELRRRLCLASIPTLLVQRRFRHVAQAVWRPTEDAGTIKADLKPLSIPRVFDHAQ